MAVGIDGVGVVHIFLFDDRRFLVSNEFGHGLSIIPLPRYIIIQSMKLFLVTFFEVCKGVPQRFFHCASPHGPIILKLRRHYLLVVKELCLKGLDLPLALGLLGDALVGEEGADLGPSALLHYTQIEQVR